MSERPEPDELVDWLCWVWATDGERFYPPDETADECSAAIAHPDDEPLAWERGYHARAYGEAVERFADLEASGVDPVERAERYIEAARARGLDLPSIEWRWLEAAKTDDDSGGDD